MDGNRVYQDFGLYEALEFLFVDSPIRTVATFKSNAFNTSEQKSYFINPGCYGDDLAEWVKSELRNRGLKTDENPGQEDFGWYLNYQDGDVTFTLLIGYRPGDEHESGTWIGWLERKRGPIGFLAGRQGRGIGATAVEAIHKVLTSNPQVQNLRWHYRRDFDAGKEEHGTLTPDGVV